MTPTRRWILMGSAATALTLGTGCMDQPPAEPPSKKKKGRKSKGPDTPDQPRPDAPDRLPDDDDPPILDPDAPRKTTGRTPEIPDNFERLQMESDGLTREAVIHVPTDLGKKEKVPLILGLHGNNGNAAVMFRQNKLGRLVTERRWIGVFPECDVWTKSDPKPDLADDRFLGALLKKMVSDYPVDPARIWVVGFSGGGRRAFNLASRYSDLVSAIVVSGTSIGFTDGGPSGWNPTERDSLPVSVLQVHGAKDPVISARGGLTQAEMPMDSVGLVEGLEIWAEHIGAKPVEPAPTPEHCPAENRVMRWENGKGHALVGVIERDLSHRWPKWLTDAVPAFLESVPTR